MMRRRTFIASTVSVLAAPLAAQAQQPAKVYRIGTITSEYPLDASDAFNPEKYPGNWPC
jgi:hypothetical protein